MKVKPNIFLKGGVVEITMPFHIDPLNYQREDFMINQSPLKLISLSKNRFIGQITKSVEEGDHIVYEKESQVAVSDVLKIPKEIIKGLNNLESSPIFDSKGSLFFLDIKPRFNFEEETIIYQVKPASYEVSEWLTVTKGLNSLFIHEDVLYCTSKTSNDLYKINENKELEVVTSGLGLPFGINYFNNSLMVGDLEGNLFKIDKDHKGIFVAELPSKCRGYYFASFNDDEFFISAPTNSGKNKILVFTKEKKLVTFLETLHILGGLAFSPKGELYWLENTRNESILYRERKGIREKVMSGIFFNTLTFDQSGNLYINDFHKIYKIKEQWLNE